MSLALLVLFNLLVNGILAFTFANALSWGAARWLRLPPGRAQVALAALPFAKLVFDTARGIPEHSFFWQRAQGVARDLGSFQIGVGVRWCFVQVNLALGALAGDAQYSDSAADIVGALLARRVAAWVPAAIAAVLLARGLMLFAARATEWLRAWRFSRELRAEGELCEVHRVGFRRVALYVTHKPVGSPFASGLLRSTICFPHSLWLSLSETDRRAAVAHELGHVAQHHLPLVYAIGLLEDLFWFVPGITASRRRLREALELAADRWAVARGHAPLALASALVHVGQALRSSPAQLGRATCGAAHESLVRRIAELCDDAPAPPRFGCQRRYVRASVALWMTVSVLTALAFGNH